MGTCSKSVISELDGEFGIRVELEQSDVLLLLAITSGRDVDRERRNGDPTEPEPETGSSEPIRVISGLETFEFVSFGVIWKKNNCLIIGAMTFGQKVLV
jgi:hypothetical protein